ncbi:MAG: MFS transporter, partial [Xanthomonadaceae bacterium]|nr:MFS transporter [Xanthomonadaceae bacterium]
PQHARWLAPAEKEWIADELERQAPQSPKRADRGAFASVVMDVRTWLAAIIWCSTLIGANGLIFWLPQVIKEMSTLNDLAIGVLSALPWVGVAIGMVANSWHSDLKQERYRHLGIALAVGTIALFLASLVSHGAVALFLLFLGGVGLGGAQGVFWSIPTAFLQRSVAAAGITLINLVGNLGSLLGPYIIGLIRARSDSFAEPIWFVAAVMASGAILISLLHVSERRLTRGH